MLNCFKNKFVVAVVLLGYILIFSGCQSGINNNEARLSIQKEELPVIKSNTMFYEARNFGEAVEWARETQAEKDIQIVVVSHHLLASRYTADLIKRASGRQIDKVFIVGPNHENIGRRAVASVLAKWQVSNGWVESDKSLVERFLTDFGLNSSWEVFEREHAVGAIVPWIKYFLPEARIVPIVFSSYAGKNEAEQVSNWLYNYWDDVSLLVVSVDFSHYLTKDEADKRDELTSKLIEVADIDGVLRLDNTENVDSPVSLAVGLMLAKKRGLETQIVHHDNAFNLMVEKPVETTSYFGIVFKSTQ